MWEFSLYASVIRAMESFEVETKDLGDTDLECEEARRGTTTFLTRVNGMRHWCRENERIVVDRNLSDARLYVGFQRMSRTRGVIRRYQKLCATAKEVWVFAQEDWRPMLPYAGLVAIDDITLCKEWFLLIQSEQHSALLVAQELDSIKRHRSSLRLFKGISTFDPRLVSTAREGLMDWIATFI